jgi:hypothetical protein
MKSPERIGFHGCIRCVESPEASKLAPIQPSGFVIGGLERFIRQVPLPSLDGALSTGATAQEILARLGKPAQRSGWWPCETWEYTDGQIFTLCHGVVE